MSRSNPDAVPLSPDEASELAAEGYELETIDGHVYNPDDLYACVECGTHTPRASDLDDEGLCASCASEAGAEREPDPTAQKSHVQEGSMPPGSRAQRRRLSSSCCSLTASHSHDAKCSCTPVMMATSERMLPGPDPAHSSTKCVVSPFAERADFQDTA